MYNCYDELWEIIFYSLRFFYVILLDFCFVVYILIYLVEKIFFIVRFLLYKFSEEFVY